ncbi:Transcriptional regulator [Microbacterium sp. C448]|uniref:TetR/AcrR family transcriptional regulator n=1 Tax=Microbacterium TaxID=33882 RepID=UPI0003DE0541|nr:MULTISPECIES: TetR/AcrR family transcriptional regulator [Microbacterium]MDO8383685.1 TetR/AcrR family transcriptional regulator [Microbacterium sp.]CDK01207.1 Transcriptional regulator [Microbacterium sp. C448]
MSSEPRGRPRASSREVLAEAACELFLEQGYGATSVSDITRRAGVSRSSFFNYFPSKADVLWGGFDERIAELGAQLEPIEGADAGAVDVDVRAALASMAQGFAPDSLALALVNARQMELDDELEREASVRQSRIARVLAERMRGAGVEELRAAVIGSAYGGALMAAVEEWARQGAGRVSLGDVLDRALAVVSFRVG